MADQGQVPTEVMDEVVWREVTQHLSSLDIGNLMQVSASMRNLVPGGRKWESLPASVLFVIAEHLYTTDMMNCRQVCQRWTKCVDYVLPRMEEVPAATYYDRTIIKTEFVNAEGLEQFLNETTNHPRNPLIGRTVGVARNISSARFREAFTTLLQRFGSEVWTMSLNYYPTSREFPDDMLPFFHNVLMLVPNLQTLRITTTSEEEFGGNYSRADAQDGAEAAMEYLAEHPFPSMPKLTTVENIDCRTRKSYLIPEILKSCCEPATLKCLSITALEHGFEDVWEFKNLELLQIHLISRQHVWQAGTLRCSADNVVVAYEDEVRIGYDCDLSVLLVYLAIPIKNARNVYIQVNCKAKNSLDNLSFLFPRLEELKIKYFAGSLTCFPIIHTLKVLTIENQWQPRSYADPEWVTPENEVMGCRKLLQIPVSELEAGVQDIWINNPGLEKIVCNGKLFTRP